MCVSMSEFSSVQHAGGGRKDKNSVWLKLIVSVVVAMGYVYDKPLKPLRYQWEIKQFVMSDFLTFSALVIG